MARTFNIAGPNNARIHYTLDPESRLPGLRQLIEEQNYFVVHAPRQTGKTTLLDTMARKLTAEGRYAALRFSIESSRPYSKDTAGMKKSFAGMMLFSQRLTKICAPPYGAFDNNVRRRDVRA